MLQCIRSLSVFSTSCFTTHLAFWWGWGWTSWLIALINWFYICISWHISNLETWRNTAGKSARVGLEGCRVSVVFSTSCITTHLTFWWIWGLGVEWGLHAECLWCLALPASPHLTEVLSFLHSLEVVEERGYCVQRGEGIRWFFVFSPVFLHCHTFVCCTSNCPKLEVLRQRGVARLWREVMCMGILGCMVSVFSAPESAELSNVCALWSARRREITHH